MSEVPNLDMLPNSIIKTFEKGKEPLTPFQKILLASLLRKAQADILEHGLEKLIK